MALKLLALFGLLAIVFNFAAGYWRRARPGRSTRVLLATVAPPSEIENTDDTFPIEIGLPEFHKHSSDDFSAHQPGGEVYVAGGALDTFNADDDD